jgi:PDZ domain-containing protein
VRRLVLLASVGVVAAAALLVPLPLVELSPGPTIDVPPVLSFDGHQAHRVNGKVLATTVLLTQPRAPEVVASWFSGDHEILRQHRVAPAGVSQQEYVRYEREVFVESAHTGAAVGLKAAGLPVNATGRGARVVAVVRGSSADGHLRPGDVITAVGGKAVQLSSDLVAATAGASAGTLVSLTVQRNGATSEMRLPLRHIGQLGRPGLGVDIVSVTPRIDLPFPVNINVSDVGGPSAGLMIALAAYDLATPADVIRGRTVAGTGTIDVSGRVGAVGGVAEKVAAAERDHASLFLAPAGEAAEARSAAGPGMRVVAVRTFADALAAVGAG